MTVERIAGIAAFAVVVLGVAIGFAAIGPPQHVRLVELDRRRVSDLQSIENTLRFDPAEHVTGFQPKLPSQRGNDWPRDPLTSEPYGYQRENATRYRLCATFALPSDADENPLRWRHGAGRTCYRLDISAARREQVFNPIRL
jgi:hypothetical protein